MTETPKPPMRDVHWRAVGLGYAASAAATLVLALLTATWGPGAWGIALSGTVFLLLAGLAAGALARSAEPLNGALIGILYLGTFALIMFVGSATDTLPDPLPGLEVGDSTFFFAWPLAQILVPTLGAMLGGRTLARPSAAAPR
ncbi:MAG: hypothetical protein HYY05_08930 [Chloroflexi bacterium]|nr:hypothetical protein [Chloroflexota bacterium]